MTSDPDWPRASDWLAASRASGPGRSLSVVGIPLSLTSLSPSGASQTPAAVRLALRRISTFHAGLEVDLEAVRVQDHGDLPVSNATTSDALERVEEALLSLGLVDDRGPRHPIIDPSGEERAGAAEAGLGHRAGPDLVVLLGGDNAITRPAMRTLMPLATSGLLTLDAHHDVRGFHAGATNGTPVRGLIEDGLAGRHVVQIGLGNLTNSRAYRTWCDEQGITSVLVDDARGRVGALVRAHLDRLAETCEDLYVDLDVDVVDKAFVPGCPGARPGGLAPYELLEAAVEAGKHLSVRAIDITEVDATADPDGRTVDLAAMCLLSAAAGLATR